MDLQLYKFRPLRSGEIRLLQLESAERLSDELRGTMHVLQLGKDSYTSRENKTPYAALSYAWGRSDPDGSHLTEVICCDGRIIRITSSLARGLRRIREIKPTWWVGLNGYNELPTKRPPLLWVDQVCIDQQDLGERNREVARMANIYKSCVCLIIWLDEIDDAGGARIRQAITMDHPGQEPKCLLELQWRKSLEYFGFDNDWGYDLDKSTRLSIMMELMERAFFRRRWCVQECVNTLRVSQFMLIGGTIIQLHDVRDSGRLLDIPDNDRGDAIFRPDMHTVRYLLQEFDVAECTLDHDRVYSLLPLAKDVSEYDLRIDYSQPFENICRDMVKGAMHPASGGDGHLFQLIVLAASRPAMLMRNPPKLPTWMPDWKVPRTYTDDDHMSITRTFAYPNYLVPSDHLQIHGDHAFLRGEAIQPCFPPCNLHQSRESENGCQCCVYWSAKYYQWTEKLRALLNDATLNGLVLFTPSFQHGEEFQTLFGKDRMTFVLSPAAKAYGVSQQQVYHLQSSFNGSTPSNQSFQEDTIWICLC